MVDTNRLSDTIIKARKLHFSLHIARFRKGEAYRMLIRKPHILDLTGIVLKM
jgi:hypothetical protein